MFAHLDALALPRVYVRAAVVAAVFAVGAAQATAATYFAETATNATAGSGGASQSPDHDLFNGSVAGSSVSSSQILVGTSSNGAQAGAESGASVSAAAVHAYAWQSALINSGNPDIYSSYGIGSVGIATAEFNDAFMLNAAGYAPGTLVLMTFSIAVSGTVGGNASISQPLGGYGNGSYESNWRATTTVNYDSFEQVRHAGGSTTSSLILTGSGPVGIVTQTARVIVGELNPVMLRAEATAFGSGNSDQFPRGSTLELGSFADLGHTLSWGGIVSLRTMDGVAITDFTAWSASSGFNYLQAAPVPEPHAWALMLGGLLLLGASASRQFRRARLA